jgi:hypothetical protein
MPPRYKLLCTDEHGPTHEDMMTEPSTGTQLGILGGTVTAATIAGAAASLALMLRVGHRNESRLLIAMFAVWVLSPFVAMIVASVVSRRWASGTRAVLYALTLVLTIASVAIYAAVALGPPRPKPAFFFLVVPFASWLVLAIALPLAGLIFHRPPARSQAR